MPLHLLQVFVNFIELCHDLLTDKSPVDPFVVMSEEIPETGDSGKTVGKTRFQYSILTQNIECLRVGLGARNFPCFITSSARTMQPSANR